MAEGRGIMTGPRWADISSFLKNTAWMYNLDISVEIDKGWITKTVRFAVEGDSEDIDKFHIAIEEFAKGRR